MPQTQQQPSLARPSSRQEPVTSSVSSQQPLQNEVHPMIHQVRGSNPVVTSIKRSIYTHVNELIAQNEERPEQLARIYHNLQNMNSSEIMANLNNESSINRRRRWGPSMYREVEEDEDEEEDD